MDIVLDYKVTKTTPPSVTREYGNLQNTWFKADKVKAALDAVLESALTALKLELEKIKPVPGEDSFEIQISLTGKPGITAKGLPFAAVQACQEAISTVLEVLDGLSDAHAVTKGYAGARPPKPAAPKS